MGNPASVGEWNSKPSNPIIPLIPLRGSGSIVDHAGLGGQKEEEKDGNFVHHQPNSRWRQPRVGRVFVTRNNYNSRNILVLIVSSTHLPTFVVFPLAGEASCMASTLLLPSSPIPGSERLTGSLRVWIPSLVPMLVSRSGWFQLHVIGFHAGCMTKERNRLTARFYQLFVFLCLFFFPFLFFLSGSTSESILCFLRAM